MTGFDLLQMPGNCADVPVRQVGYAWRDLSKCLPDERGEVGAQQRLQKALLRDGGPTGHHFDEVRSHLQIRRKPFEQRSPQGACRLLQSSYADPNFLHLQLGS